jgi:two-component system, cell cycle sensor histidine kinase and response regulator CckA
MPLNLSLVRQVMDCLAEGVLVVETGPDPLVGRIIAANGAMEAVTGLAAAELVEADPMVLAARGLDQGSMARLRNAVLQEQPFRADAAWQFGNRPTLPVEVVVTPLDGPGTNPAHWLWQFRDIRERQQLEQQIWQAQRMETVGLLARGISHDFNNILTALSGYTSFLLQGIPYDDPLRADAMEIERAARRAALLIDQLLFFSRREGIRPRLMDVNQVISAILPTLERLAGEHIHVLADLGNLPGAILADERQLQQIVINLVANSRDAMPGGGTITLSTAPTWPEDVLPGSRVDQATGAQVLLTVTDTGSGMTPDTKAQLFKPFFTTKDPGESPGLGLATVHGLVRQLGGYVWVQSEINQGTTLRIYLPVAGTTAPLAPAPTPREVPVLGGHETILFVEDEPTILNLGRRLLEGFGYRVLAAGSAAEATAIAGERGSEVDLLLTDIVMPGQHGPDLAEELLVDHPHLRVLCVSGHPQGAGPVKEGAHRFRTLEKPFTADELAHMVREVLDGPLASP